MRQFAELDHLDAPDLWDEIARRATRDPAVVRLVPGRVEPAPAAPQRFTPTAVAIAAVAAAIALVALGAFLGRRSDHGRVALQTNGGATDHAWRLGPAVRVPGGAGGAAPLLAASNGNVLAAFDQSTSVVVDGPGGEDSVAAGGPVVAVGAGPLEPGARGVVLLADGRLRVVGAAGRITTVADVGPLGGTPSIAIVGRRVFVAGTMRGVVTVDLATEPRTVRAIPGVSANALASRGPLVWALDESHDRLYRIDGRRAVVTAQLDTGHALAVGASANGAYLLRPGVQKLSFVGARLRLVDIAHVEPSSSAVAVSNGDVWVGSYGLFSAIRVRDAKFAGAVGQLAAGDAAIASDGTTVWDLGTDGLRRIVPAS